MASFQNKCTPQLEACHRSGSVWDCTHADLFCNVDSSSIQDRLRMEADFDVYDIRLPAKGLRHGVDSHVEYLGNRSIMTAIGARSPYTICSAISWVYWDIHKTGDSKSFPHYFSNTYLAHVPPRALQRRQRRHQYSSGMYVCNITIFVKFFMGNKFRSTRTCEYMITLFIHSVGRGRRLDL